MSQGSKRSHAAKPLSSHRTATHPTATNSDRSGGGAAGLEELIHSSSAEVLRQAAADRRLTEDLALALLERRDLPQGVIEELAKNAAVMKSRLALIALVRNPRTPRHVSLPIARHLYTFELMQIALTPAIAADIKMAVEEAMVGRLESISAGERLTLAKRASARVAAALLLDAERRIIEAALANPYLTEAWIVKALMREEAPPALVETVSRHGKWSLRQEIRVALLRNDKTPLGRAVEFAQSLPTHVLREVLAHSRLSASVKLYLLKELEDRGKAAHHRDTETQSE